jgi:hypothetical protein
MSNFDVHGETSLNGRKLLRVVQNDREARITFDALSDRRKAISQLAEAGIILATRKDAESLFSKFSEIRDFPDAPIADHIGWNGNFFLVGADEAFAPEDTRVVVPHDLMGPTRQVGGDAAVWRRGVARRLLPHRIGLFALSVPLVAPLLELLPGASSLRFEFVGPPGIGKSTLQRLAASTIGAPKRSGSGGYVMPFNELLKDPENLLRQHRALPLILDEVDEALIGLTPAKRRNAFRTMTSGSRTDGCGHVCMLLSSNSSLLSLLGRTGSAEPAAAKQLITIPIGAESEFGVFDRVPKKCSDMSAFTEELIRCATANHGHAFRQFAQKLMQQHNDDPDALAMTLSERLQTFQKNAHVNLNDGATVERARAFGLVYAAACFAVDWNVFTASKKKGRVPKREKALESVLHCYRLHLGALPRTEPPADRILEVAHHQRTVIVPASRKGAKYATRVRQAPFIVKRDKVGDELIVKRDRIHLAFPDWDSLRGHLDLQALMVTSDEPNEQPKRQVASVDLGRPYVFKLPRDWSVGSELLPD